MELDVDIEPTFRLSYMKCIDKQKDIAPWWCILRPDGAQVPHIPL